MNPARTWSVLALASILAATPVLAQQDADRASARALFRSQSCGGCHDRMARTVGPSMTEIAQRYRGMNAVAAIAARIRAGSQGLWGSGAAHPPYHALSDQQAELLAQWMVDGSP